MPIDRATGIEASAPNRRKYARKALSPPTHPYRSVSFPFVYVSYTSILTLWPENDKTCFFLDLYHSLRRTVLIVSHRPAAFLLSN